MNAFLNRWRRRLMKFFFILAGLTIVLEFGSTAYYLVSSPRIAVIATGQLYATNINHGTVVYLTHCQQFWVSHLIDVGIGFLLISALLYLPDAKPRQSR